MFIVGSIFSCVFWGLVIALAITAATLFVVKSLTVNRSLTLGSWCVGLALFLSLAFQATLTMGAFKAKALVAQVESSYRSLAQKSSDIGGNEYATSLREVLKEYANDYPYIAKTVDANAATAADAERAISDAFSEINWYIVRRIGWSVLFLVVGIVSLVKTMKSVYRRRSERAPLSSQRRAPVSTRTARRRR